MSLSNAQRASEFSGSPVPDGGPRERPPGAATIPEKTGRLLADGVDVRAIQLILGHSDVKQTQRYLNVTDEELRKTLSELWQRRREAQRRISSRHSRRPERTASRSRIRLRRRSVRHSETGEGTDVASSEMSAKCQPAIENMARRQDSSPLAVSSANRGVPVDGVPVDGHAQPARIASWRAGRTRARSR